MREKMTMKAISIREPWASLIHTGKKTIETRTWKTDYRGPLLLCASKKPDWIEIEPGWISQRSFVAGQAFATCRLVDVRPMTESDQELACCSIYPRANAWILENVKPIKPRFNVKGQLGLFDVEVTIDGLS
jgi:hypothetical protein